MLSNLPPGVTEDMLPGSRPEDEEREFVLTISVGEISHLIQVKKHDKDNELHYFVCNILEQIEEDMGGFYEQEEDQ